MSAKSIFTPVFLNEQVSICKTPFFPPLSHTDTHTHTPHTHSLGGLLSSWEIKPLFLVERACFLRSTTTGCWGFKTRALQTLRRSELSPKSSHSKPLNCSLLYQ